MSLSRSRRITKVINYNTIENDTSDEDDFCDFTPPSKKLKESKKKKESNNDSASDSPTTSVKTSTRNKSPKERVSVNERKFQRDMELALVLSSSNQEDFQGFNKENEEKSENLEFFSPLRNSVVAVEVHALPSKLKVDKKNYTDLQVTELTHQENSDTLEKHPTPKENLNTSLQNENTVFHEENTMQKENTDPPGRTAGQETKIIQEEENNQDNIKVSSPCKKKSDVPSVGFSENRQRKKVNFVEDDSDSWSEDEIRSATKSETDESDYFPSPTKIKKQKTKTEKSSKGKEPPSSKFARTRKPLKDKQISSENSLKNSSTKSTKLEPEITKDKKSKNTKSELEIAEIMVVKPSKSDKTTKAEPGVKSSKLKSTISNSKSDVNDNNLMSSKSNLSRDAKSQVLTSFKSPTINSVSSPKVPSRIGLRLGLSRKTNAKPLHPNASVK